ncbi:hypothetical protein D3C87_557430 [compost metagenome]
MAAGTPSLSSSVGHPPEGTGLHGSNGLLPLVTSVPSLIPSPSVSGFVGLVPKLASCVFVSPSESWSHGPAAGLGLHGFNGLLPLVTSSPSFTPSPSVSGLVGLVPAVVSSALVRPSLS